METAMKEKCLKTNFLTIYSIINFMIDSTEVGLLGCSNFVT